MKFTFNPVSSMRAGRGKALLSVLALSEPEMFRDLMVRVLSPGLALEEEELCGIFVRSEGSEIHCVAILLENRVDRIYTIPRFRGRGYAKQVLVFLRMISMMSKFSFESPVNPEVVPLFTSAGWTRKGSTPNKDGTMDMVAFMQTHAPVMDMGQWVTFVETLGTL